MTSRAAKVFAASAVASLAIAGGAQARHGADDGAGHVRHGGDDAAGHVRHGGDDAQQRSRTRTRHRHHRRHASFERRHVEDRTDDHGGRRGRGSDDGAGHR